MITGIGSIVLPISPAIARTLSLGNKVLPRMITNKDNNYKKQYENDQQTNNTFVSLHQRNLQDNVTDKSEYHSLCDNFTRYVDEKKKQCF